MSADPRRSTGHPLDFPHRTSTDDTVFTEATDKPTSGEAPVPATAATAAAGGGAASVAAPAQKSSLGERQTTGHNTSLTRADSATAHVTFNSTVDDDAQQQRRRNYSNLRLQPSGSFTNNGSVFTNGNIVRTASGLQGTGAAATTAAAVDKKPVASSPLQLLYQSFANPVSDAQAIENAVREALGHEPMWPWTPTDAAAAAPPVVVHDGADEAQAIAAFSTGDELRGCDDPSVHYIFRNIIRAPRGERPRPYLYAEDSDNLALATAAQAAVRHRHHGLQQSCSSDSSGSPASRSEPSVNETVVPLVGLRRHRQHHHSHIDSQRDVEGGARGGEEGEAAGSTAQGAVATSLSSSPPRTRASHEPTADVVEGKEREATQARQRPSSAAPSPCLTATEEVPMDPTNRINRTYLCTGAFHGEPISEADIGKEELIVDTFNALPSERRRLELLEAFYVAHIQPYEQNASYTADDWDDMTQTKVRRWFAVEFDPRRGCFFVTLFRRRVRIFLFSFLFRAFCLFLFWVIMFCLVPRNWFYPGGLYFDTIDTIVFAGIAGTLVARVLTVPSIVGVIWAGILWNNVPYTSRLTKGITLDMRQFISMFGLTIGLIRAGLSLNVIRFKQKFKHYIAFSLLPMSMEMVVHGVCCKYIYGYPNFRWAFAEGFLLSSIAPSVVVPVIISFQRRGYGVRDGPSMMMLCSIAVDTAACVWGIEFLLSLEFHKMDTALLIVLAPIQVLVGLVGGVILGALVFVVTFYILFMEGERLPSVRSDRMMTLRHSVHVRYISIFFMVLVAFSGIAIGKRFSVLGGSAIGVVTIAGTFNYLCVRGGTADHLRVKADMAQTLTTVWDYIAMPSLFGLSGAAVNVHELFARDFIGQAFGLVFIGIGTRSLFAMLVPIITRLGLSWPEILFCGLGWIGKGSVQGSLGSLAQTYATAELAAATTPEAVAAAHARVEFGRKMKNTAILGILVACPLCSIFLTRFTDRLLKPNT